MTSLLPKKVGDKSQRAAVAESSQVTHAGNLPVDGAKTLTRRISRVSQRIPSMKSDLISFAVSALLKRVSSSIWPLKLRIF